MKSRKEISQQLGMTEQYLSMLLSGERKISWPLAEKLTELFPGKSISEWKRAATEELKRAVAQIDMEKVA